ncbi:MAG: DUF2237 domain-containing protein [uncultured Campylobacterales bacterium]|uniref:DUF2237 domain-containing protein n=1 Tax=uncultured Campylobacterales bacterium TaxID=352960 RepID=A0A6S6SC33_9BACT|nr:MAG: DUF2237 domain-containing protein [uncultured Campylobacterales bacterium]
MSNEINQKSILGIDLLPCCDENSTGYFRDGYCRTNEDDKGRHTVCAEITDEFLQFSLSKGNDLIAPNVMFGFPGLKAGDKWCLCALRWLEAYEAGVAPKIFLESTHEKTLEVVSLEVLQKFAT